MNYVQSLFVIVAVLALTAHAGAALLVEDGFEAGGSTPAADQYQSDPMNTNGTDNNSIDGQGPARLGFTGDWSVNSTPFDDLTDVVDPAGLTYTDANGNMLDTTPGHVRYINGFGKHGVERSAHRTMTLGGPLTDHTPEATGLYIAMLLRVNETILDTYDDVVGDLRGPHVELPYGDDDIRFGIQKNQAGDGVEAYAIHERNPGSVDRTAAGVTEAVSAGDTVLIISHHYTDGGDKFELWINPEDLSDELVGKDYSGAQAGDRGYVGSNSGWGLEEFVFNPGGQSAAGGVFEVDEIRIGTSWAEVTPYFVPEPTSFAAVMMLAGAWATTRRRR